MLPLKFVVPDVSVGLHPIPVAAVKFTEAFAAVLMAAASEPVLKRKF
jgi:hypothetical protein